MRPPYSRALHRRTQLAILSAPLACRCSMSIVVRKRIHRATGSRSAEQGRWNYKGSFLRLGHRRIYTDQRNNDRIRVWDRGMKKEGKRRRDRIRSFGHSARASDLADESAVVDVYMVHIHNVEHLEPTIGDWKRRDVCCPQYRSCEQIW